MGCNHSIVYTPDGTFQKILTIYPIFRKMKPFRNEIAIARRLMKYPCPHIVTIYKVTNDYIDMELLTDVGNNNYDQKAIEKAHRHFLKLGIVYIDWKPENYGKDCKGNTKVFDFDGSGIFSYDSKKWVYNPPPWGAFLIAGTDRSPIEVDEYTFTKRIEIWE